MQSPKTPDLRFTLAQRIQINAGLLDCSRPAPPDRVHPAATMTFEEGAIQSLDEAYPGIFPFWHRCVLPATWLYRHQHPAVMTSRSLDGEFIARVIRRFDSSLSAAPVRAAAPGRCWR